MEHEMNEGLEKIDLFKIFRKFLPYLRKFWLLILILAVVNGSQTFMKLHRSYRPMYRCEAMFAVQINFEGATDISSYRYNYDKTAAEQVVDTLPYILNSNVMRELILQELGTSYINGSTSVNAVPGTNFFQMTVTSSDPNDAHRVLMATIARYPQVLSHVMGSAQINLIRDPVPPTEPYNHFTWKKQVFADAMSGAVLGVGILVALAALRRTVLSTNDIKRILSLPCLVSVPNIKAKKRKSSVQTNLLITNQQSDSTFCEAFRLLRLKLLRRMEEGDQVLMFTSTLPSEGKSSLAANTALALAKDGKKVLLIDADLRSPSVKGLLNVEQPSSGLGDYLKEGLSAVSFLCYKDSRLHLFAGDTPISEPTQLLQYEKMDTLIQSLRPMFDYIILDTPPCSMMTDAAAFSQHADKVVYVIREDYAASHQIYDSIQALSAAGADICGYVFNRASSVNTARYGRYGYSKRYGYGYGRKDTSGEEAT